MYERFAKLEDSSAIAYLLSGRLDTSANGSSSSRQSGSESLPAETKDPTAILTQLQIQNVFIPSTHDAHGYANQTIIQLVLPLSTGWDLFPKQIIRPTLPLHVHTADPDGPVEGTSGLGDLIVFDLFVPERRSWGAWGVGPVAVFPTASDDRLGQGKWQLGPAAAVVYTGVKNWNLGVLVQNPISFAGDSDRSAVSTLMVQPIAVRFFEDGWYAGWGEMSFIYEWLNGDYNIPLNLRFGRVMEKAKVPLDIFVEPFYTPSGLQSGGQPEWGFKLNVGLLFP